MKTRVLSIDGGGIRGIISAVILAELEEILQYLTKKKDARLSDYFDVIGGTSSGAILAAIYVCPGRGGRPKYTAKEAVEFFINHGDEIFDQNGVSPFHSLVSLFSPKYSNKKLHSLLNHYLGDLTINQAVKPCMLTAYNTANRKAVLFSRESQKRMNKDCKLVDAVMASTAAPTYFPPIQIQKKDCYIDGGVFAGNPAICALVEGLKQKGCKGFESTYICSIGNVFSREVYPYEEVKGWGLMHWAVPMFDILMDASSQTVDYQLSKIFHSLHLEKNYLRMALEVEESEEIPKIDDTSSASMEKLMNYAEQLLQSRYVELVSFAKQIIS